MDKIQLYLSVPAIETSYELFVPVEYKVKELSQLLADSVKELSSGRYVPNGDETLCSREFSRILPPDAFFSECGISNGDHLVLL